MVSASFIDFQFHFPTRIIFAHSQFDNMFLYIF